MACFKPLKAWQKVVWDWKCNPYEHEHEKKLLFKNPNSKDYREIEIPCGRCLGCRLDKANDYATRAHMELKYHEKNSFITLTYDPKNVPKNRGKLTLKKKDAQNFIKRLRKETAQKFKYILCGEYGNQTHRPHYHAILFGYWPEDTKIGGISKTKNYWYTSKNLEKTWGKGYVSIDEVNYAAIAYVARYTMKKAGIKAEKLDYTGETEIKEKFDERNGEIYYKTINKRKVNPFDNYGREKEFILISKKPAIGLKYLEENKDELLKKKGYYLKLKDKTMIRPIPKYFLKKINPQEKADLQYEAEKSILKNREEIAKRIKTDENEEINKEKAIKKHREYLKTNLEERAKFLKRNQN